MSHTYTPDPTNLPTGYAMPDDGPDLRSAATVNTPMEGLADGVAYLAAHVVGFDQVLHVEASDDGSTWTSWDSRTNTAYGELGAGVFRIDGDAFTSIDRLRVDVTLQCYITGGIGAMVRLAAGPAGGPYTALPGSRVHVTSTDSTDPNRLKLQGMYAVPSDGPYDVIVQWRELEPGETVHVIGDASMQVLVLKA